MPACRCSSSSARRSSSPPAGTELLHHSRLIIQQFEDAEAAMTQFKGVAGGRLNVAVISAGDYFLPRLLVEFARRHEGVTLNLAVHNREDLLHQLADNLTDLAVMVRPPRRRRHRQRGLRAAPLRDRRRRRAPAGRRERASRCRGWCASPSSCAREGSDTWHVDGRALRPPSATAQHRDGDQEHRDHQAGGHGRHGHQPSCRPTPSAASCATAAWSCSTCRVFR